MDPGLAPYAADTAVALRLARQGMYFLWPAWELSGFQSGEAAVCMLAPVSRQGTCSSGLGGTWLRWLAWTRLLYSGPASFTMLVIWGLGWLPEACKLLLAVAATAEVACLDWTGVLY